MLNAAKHLRVEPPRASVRALKGCKNIAQGFLPWVGGPTSLPAP